MRTLVTGASGFAGSVTARSLARDGFEVVAVYRRETPFLTSLRGVPGVSLLRGDLLEAAGFPGPYAAVVHIATTSPGPGVSAERIVRDNVLGTFALVEAALNWQVRRFVFFSSLSIYGDIIGPVVDESTPIRSPDIYGTSKYLGERRLREVADRLPAVALRLPGIVGPGAHRNWLSRVATQLRSGETIRAFHLDRPFNNAAHVEDVAGLVANLLQRDWGGFDAVVLGARGMTTVREAVLRLAQGLAVSPRLDSTTPAKASFILCCERAIARWGYDPMDIETVIDRYARDVIAAEGWAA